MKQQVARVFVGVDSRERLQARVCVESLLDHATIPVVVTELRLADLMHAGLYRRPWRYEDGHIYDVRDQAVATTEFTYARYLVPALMLYRGFAVFVDSDFLWRSDVAELWALRRLDHAIQVVKHGHDPDEAQKLRGVRQDRYERKNWTSLAIWHCGHGRHRFLSPYRVNEAPRLWLHQLRWLEDHEIGALPGSWNWIEGVTAPESAVDAVHFTRGTPDMEHGAGAAYADEWRAIAERPV